VCEGKNQNQYNQKNQQSRNKKKNHNIENQYKKTRSDRERYLFHYTLILLFYNNFYVWLLLLCNDAEELAKNNKQKNLFKEILGIRSFGVKTCVCCCSCCVVLETVLVLKLFDRYLGNPIEY
jgi:hypothetical protein